MTIYIPVLGKRLRLTRLDVCGNVPEAAALDAVVTTKGFISVGLTAEVETGTEIMTRRADGSICVNERLSDEFKRFNVEIEFCGVDPGTLSVTTNAKVYNDYQEDPRGFTVGEGKIEGKYALELWTGLSGQACVPGAEEASGYLLLPFVQAGVLGDISVNGENAVTFSMTGGFTKGGNAWGVGPYDVLMDDASAPAPLPTAIDTFDHLLMIDTALAPPAEAEGLQPMPS